MFVEMPASETGIQFTNTLEQHHLFNILYYLYYYNGAGVSTGDINNDGLPDIFFAANHPKGNKLYLNKGNFKFEDITEKAGVAGEADWCTGSTMADVNGDGFLDIYVGAISGKYDLKGHNQLFINQGNGSFKEEANKYGLDFAGLNTQSAFFDYDNDGDLDCYLLNQSHHPHANIVDTSFRTHYDAASGDRLYRNDVNVNGKFTEVSKEAGIYQSNLGYGLGLAVADINNDGFLDIYIGNDFHENDYYYVNQGNGTFHEEGAKHFKHYSRFSMGNDVADYNNDGQVDIVTADMLPPDEKVLKTYGSDENPDIYKVKLELRGYQKQYSKNSLQRNNGDGKNFSETSLLSGVSATDWSWATLFADFDNDGNKDLFISSGIVKRPVDLDYIRFVSDLDMKKGRQQTDAYDEIAIKNMPDGAFHPFFFQGDGVLNFEDKSSDWGTASMKGYYTGSSYADLDNDGDLDMVINCINAPASMLRNDAPTKLSMTFRLKGNAPNTSGIGTKVWIFAEGKMQYQQLMLTRGFQSSVEPRLHFGMDSTKYIDSLFVVWPSGKYQVVRNIPVVGFQDLREAEAGGKFEYQQLFPPKKESFAVAKTPVEWKHTENDFLDYNRQYLIPHQLSTRGPKIASGDINKDGYDDIYVGGASGQPGLLALQTAGDKLRPVQQEMLSANAASEEVDALFFDANNDSYPDLYVVSGGNYYRDGDTALADHFYLNDGKGKLMPAQQNIPMILKNKSCVASEDIDKDGDIDLFVGGLADATQYGIPQNSYLLKNDGTGKFSSQTFDSLGMVTSCAFSDLNKDGWPDLIVTGEWMAIRIFMNNKGTFQPKDLPASTGLWQCITIADLNQDGNPDILAGNWGYNTKYHAGKNGPLKMYVKDFDKNGSVEQIVGYTIDKQVYPFLAKDELERPLPILKKAYLKYGEVAGKTVDYIFYDLFKDYRECTAEELGSCYFINDGKGNFVKQVLPATLQLAPIFDFVPAGNNNQQFIAIGNFYGVIPYEGRYDALLPTIFGMKDKKNIVVTGLIREVDGELRSAKWINDHLLLVTENNGPLKFISPVK